MRIPHQYHTIENKPVFRIYFNKLHFETVIAPVYRKDLPLTKIVYGFVALTDPRSYTNNPFPGLYLKVPPEKMGRVPVTLMVNGFYLHIDGMQAREMALEFKVDHTATVL